ncbi:hypothetical protein K438DRAFT_1783943 [Mycena galopus ATCC 62051]|nr:hypothetical protein K438DRAFT_1783943 [Mycena galopus ATCC 62051]
MQQPELTAFFSLPSEGQVVQDHCCLTRRIYTMFPMMSLAPLRRHIPHGAADVVADGMNAMRGPSCDGPGLFRPGCGCTKSIRSAFGSARRRKREEERREGGRAERCDALEASRSRQRGLWACERRVRLTLEPPTQIGQVPSKQEHACTAGARTSHIISLRASVLHIGQCFQEMDNASFGQWRSYSGAYTVEHLMTREIQSKKVEIERNGPRLALGESWHRFCTRIRIVDILRQEPKPENTREEESRVGNEL